jgi:hypothetical protein
MQAPERRFSDSAARRSLHHRRSSGTLRQRLCGRWQGRKPTLDSSNFSSRMLSLRQLPAPLTTSRNSRTTRSPSSLQNLRNSLTATSSHRSIEYRNIVMARERDDGDGPRLPETYGRRLAKYQGRTRQTGWVGAGLAVLITLIGGDLSAKTIADDAPTYFPGIVVSLALCAGLALAWALTGFELARSRLTRHMEERGHNEHVALPRDVDAWPAWPELMYCLLFALTGATGVAFLVEVWVVA